MMRVIIDLDDNHSDIFSFTAIGHESTFYKTNLCVTTKAIDLNSEGSHWRVERNEDGELTIIEVEEESDEQNVKQG